MAKEDKKNKTAEQYIKDVEGKYIVPPLIREKFPDLVKLIFETESMNEEEREYWLQIMPIMTEEQIVKLRDIMVKERDQLAKLDEEYNKEMSRIKGAPAKEIDQDAMKKRLAKIKKEEKSSMKEEEEKASKLLKKLESL